jgi:hypothetical protein
MTQLTPQGTPPTQREELPQSRFTVFLHRLGLSLAAGLAIACQAQTISPNTGATPLTQASPTVSQSVGQPSATPSTAAQEQLTYTSDRGFSFQYPNGFVIQESTEPPSSLSAPPITVVDVWSQSDAAELPSLQNQGTELPANITVSLHPNPDQRDIQGWASSNNWFSSPTGFRNVTVAGEQAIAFQSTGLYESKNIALPTPDGEHIIVISHSQGGEEYPEAFEQIVSTFQLTPNS